MAELGGFCIYPCGIRDNMPTCLAMNMGEYKKMALGSFNEYMTKLNWNAAGQKVKKLLEECL